MMKVNTCSRCTWFKLFSAKTGHGECRYHAPKPYTVDIDSDKVQMVLWPITHVNDFCSKFTVDFDSVQ